MYAGFVLILKLFLISKLTYCIIAFLRCNDLIKRSFSRRFPSRAAFSRANLSRSSSSDSRKRLSTSFCFSAYKLDTLKLLKNLYSQICKYRREMIPELFLLTIFSFLPSENAAVSQAINLKTFDDS